LTEANGQGAHAEGYETKAFNEASHVEGYGVVAKGIRSHAEGDIDPQDTVTYKYTFVHEGETYNGKDGAYGTFSHREGRNTLTLGNGSHAEGVGNIAEGFAAHAEGISTHAKGMSSHTGGYYTQTSADYQTAIGMFNADDVDALFIVGNGDTDSDRRNALVVKKDGTGYLGNNKILVKGDIPTMPTDPSFTSITIDGVTLTKEKLQKLLAIADTMNIEL
jgi:hypothetical protein